MELTELPDYIRDNISSEMTIKALSRLCFTCPTKLKVNFKNQFGEPLGGFIIKTRLYAAARMLTSGQYKAVGEVGRSLGYVNLSSFARYYRRFYGHLPSEAFMKPGKTPIGKDKNEWVAEILKKYSTCHQPLKQEFEKHFGVPLIEVLSKYEPCPQP